MGYPQKLLSDGETVQFEMRPHWRALLIPIIVLAAVLFGLFFLLRLFTQTFSGALGSAGTWITWIVAAFIVILFVIRPFLYWVTTQYVFTNRRIIVRSGLISRHGRDLPLSKVNNVSFDISAGGRILNYGVLTIDTASDEPLIIADVPDVEEIQREVNRLHEEDDQRRREAAIGDFASSTGMSPAAPTPPAAAPPAPPAQSPPAPPVPPAGADGTPPAQ